MSNLDSAGRDLDSVRLPRWGKVAPSAGVVPWVVIGPDGAPVQPVQEFLRDFVAQGNAAGSVRSYAYALIRWWRIDHVSHLAHQRTDEDLATEAGGGEDDDWDNTCEECGGELFGKGQYGCECWNPTACDE